MLWGLTQAWDRYCWGNVRLPTQKLRPSPMLYSILARLIVPLCYSMKSDNATKIMLIRRHVLLLALCGMSLASTRLSAQLVESVPDGSAIQAFALDSLLDQGTDYYIPTLVSSPTVAELLATAPRLSRQLLQYYQSGGLNPYQSLLPFYSPTLHRGQKSSSQSTSLRWGAGLRLATPNLDLYPTVSSQGLEHLSLAVKGLEDTSYGLRQRMFAASPIGVGGFSEQNQPKLPNSLRLTRPSGAVAERALSDYTRETSTQGIQLPQEITYSALRQRHWIPSLESSIQFSQNHVSDNWYKGGASNLNLYMRNYFGLRYVTERVQWTNEIESKLSVYNAEKDSVHRYRIADDLLRLRSNYGVKAWDAVYYTIDAELRTQLLRSYQENKYSLQSDLLAPYTLNVGLGLKLDYSMKSKKVYGRAFDLSVNVAPLSYTFRATTNKAIDLARHGLSLDKPWYQRIGSTVRANWQWRVNMNLTWSSRLYFNTSYHQVEAEWENTLDMALTRFFSTRFNLNLRFDDAVSPASGWNKHLQYNELLSFGFSYRL